MLACPSSPTSAPEHPISSLKSEKSRTQTTLRELSPYEPTVVLCSTAAQLCLELDGVVFPDGEKSPMFTAISQLRLKYRLRGRRCEEDPSPGPDSNLYERIGSSLQICIKAAENVGIRGALLSPLLLSTSYLCALLLLLSSSLWQQTHPWLW